MTVPQDQLPCMEFCGEFAALSLFANHLCAMEVHLAEQP